MNFIDFIKYIVLGIIQGFTEPLPISSSGHLVIFRNLINMDMLNDLNFEIVVNFGSLLAILIIYKDKIIALIKDFFSYLKSKNIKYYNNFKYCLFIVIGSIPAGILGIILKDKIDFIFNNVKVIGVALLITSLALFLVKNIDGKKKKNDISYKNAFSIGLFQAIALLPGISRSGSTVVGGLVNDLKKDEAVDFSFMLYIPVSLGTMILGVSDLVKETSSTIILPYFLGMLASFITTYFSTKLFLNIVKKKKLGYFSIYCLIVGILVILFM